MAWFETVSSLVSAAVSGIALWKAVSSGKAATQARIDAKAANDRAEEALGAARQFADAVAGLHLAERARQEHEQAEREAPGIL